VVVPADLSAADEALARFAAEMPWRRDVSTRIAAHPIGRLPARLERDPRDLGAALRFGMMHTNY
jgi:hypothetical protein